MGRRASAAMSDTDGGGGASGGGGWDPAPGARRDQFGGEASPSGDSDKWGDGGWASWVPGLVSARSGGSSGGGVFGGKRGHVD